VEFFPPYELNYGPLKDGFLTDLQAIRKADRDGADQKKLYVKYYGTSNPFGKDNPFKHLDINPDILVGKIPRLEARLFNSSFEIDPKTGKITSRAAIDPIEFMLSIVEQEARRLNLPK